jgi:hypothetical protein
MDRWVVEASPERRRAGIPAGKAARPGQFGGHRHSPNNLFRLQYLLQLVIGPSPCVDDHSRPEALDTPDFAPLNVPWVTLSGLIVARKFVGAKASGLHLPRHSRPSPLTFSYPYTCVPHTRILLGSLRRQQKADLPEIATGDESWLQYMYPGRAMYARTWTAVISSIRARIGASKIKITAFPLRHSHSF